MQETRMIEQSIMPAGRSRAARSAASSDDPGFRQELDSQRRSTAETRTARSATDQVAAGQARSSQTPHRDNPEAPRESVAPAGRQNTREQQRTAGTRNGDVAMPKADPQALQARAALAGKALREDLMALLRRINQGETVPDTEEELQALVAQVIQRLERTEFSPADPEAASSGLAALAEQLQALEDSAGESGSQRLAGELVAELKRLMSIDSGSRSEASGKDETVEVFRNNTSESAALADVRPSVPVHQAQSGSQPDAGHAMRLSMDAARQLLQQAVDAVAARQAQTADIAAQAGEENSDATPEPVLQTSMKRSESLDPRFAGLLKLRNGERPEPATEPLIGRQTNPVTHQQSALQSPGDEFERHFAATHETRSLAETADQRPAAGPAKWVDQLLTPVSAHGRQAFLASGTEVARVIPQTPVTPLSGGQTIPESQIFDQVVTRLAGSFNGQSGRMVLRLHPAELGALKLDLKIEGDRVQANLQAQTQQVQEVLERNLPQLRSALAEQGLKVDQFQVNVEQRQAGESFADLQQRWNGQEPSAEQQDGREEAVEQEDVAIPLAQLMTNGSGGISLHV